MYLTLAAVLAALVATDIYDVRMTVTGIKKGVAVEANTFLVGQKPSALALYLRDTGAMLLYSIPSFVAAHYGSKPFFYAGLVLPSYYAVQHVLGGLAWRKLLK